MKVMLILGIDPGTTTTGYGLVRMEKKGYKSIKHGLIEATKNGIAGKKLSWIYKEMKRILKEYKPDVMAIEKVFFATNAKTAIRVGQAQGVMLLAASEAKVRVFEYAPGTIKKYVAGNGRADKKEVQKAVRKTLGMHIRSKPGQKTHFDNNADALAVAICHIEYTLLNGEKSQE